MGQGVAAAAELVGQVGVADVGVGVVAVAGGRVALGLQDAGVFPGAQGGGAEVQRGGQVADVGGAGAGGGGGRGRGR